MEIPELTPPHPRHTDLPWVQENVVFLVTNFVHAIPGFFRFAGGPGF